MLKRTLTTLIWLSVLPLGISAQTSSSGGLTVKSSPAGAEVTLSGDAVLSGVTPTTFQQYLIGTYQVTVKHHGFEGYSTRVTLDPTKLQSIDVTLSPKTRIKAAARSLFIPGWGQIYGEQKSKGTLYCLLAAGAVGAFIVADHDFQQKNDRFKQLVATYDSSFAAGASYQQLQSAQSAIATDQSKAYKAENLRRATIGVAIGVWSLNLLDALLFFPEDHGTFSVKGVSIAPSTRSGGFGLVLTKGF